MMQVSTVRSGLYFEIDWGFSVRMLDYFRPWRFLDQLRLPDPRPTSKLETSNWLVNGLPQFVMSREVWRRVSMSRQEF